MKRAEMILAEARKKRSVLSLSDIRESREEEQNDSPDENAVNGASEMVKFEKKMVVAPVRAGAQQMKKSVLPNGETHLQNAGTDTEGKQTTGLFSIHGRSRRRKQNVLEFRGAADGQIATNLAARKKKLQKAALASARDAEKAAFSTGNAAKDGTQTVLTVLKLAANAVAAFFAAVLANLSTILIAVVVVVSVIASVVSVLMGGWMG